MNSRNKTFRLVLRAILLAIIIVQAMVPWLGFIPLGFISLTIIHITVIIAAVVLGPKDGMVIGLFWGIATIVRAYAMPVLANEQEGKVSLLAAMTKESNEAGLKAGDLIKAIAPKVGGGGGGRPDMAQAGGKNPAGIPDALKAAKEWLAQQ